MKYLINYILLLLILLPIRSETISNSQSLKDVLFEIAKAEKAIKVKVIKYEITKALPEIDSSKVYSRLEQVDDSILIYMDSLKEAYQIPNPIYYRLIWTESRFIDTAESVKGAYGYLQVMPATFEYLNSKYKLNGSIENPKDNILAGTILLRELKNTIDSIYTNSSETYKWKLVLASYNAGFSKRHIALKKIEETQKYVKFIINQRYEPAS